MLYQQKGRKNWHSGWREPDGRWVRVSLQTANKKRAQELASMLDRLADDHQFETLALLQSGAIPWENAYKAFQHGNLALIRQAAQVIDLDPLVREWADVRLGQGVKIAMEYKRHVRRLIPEGIRFPSTKLTLPVCQQWLDCLDLNPSTRRKAAASLSSFCAFLKTRGILERNFAKDDLERPVAAPPRDLHLDTATAMKVIGACREPFATAVALAYGTGIEASVLVGLVRSDVDVERREIRARGTKTATRDRVVRVADWAWPLLLRHIQSLLPAARLFPKMDRHSLTKAHHKAIVALQLKDYRLHDARHYWAVRAIKAGTPYQVVASQLGHSSIQMVARVYGVYKPTDIERDHWEKVASMAEAQQKIG